MLATEGIVNVYTSCFCFLMIVTVNKDIPCFTVTVVTAAWAVHVDEQRSVSLHAGAPPAHRHLFSLLSQFDILEILQMHIVDPSVCFTLILLFSFFQN